MYLCTKVEEASVMRSDSTRHAILLESVIILSVYNLKIKVVLISAYGWILIRNLGNVPALVHLCMKVEEASVMRSDLTRHAVLEF